MTTCQEKGGHKTECIHKVYILLYKINIYVDGEKLKEKPSNMLSLISSMD